MTRPRISPDKPRVKPDEAAWAVAAKQAGATMWQIATFLHRKPDTLYRVIARAGVHKPKKYRPRRSVRLREVDAKLREAERQRMAGLLCRCPHCGGTWRAA